MSEKLKPCPFCGSDNVEQWETVPTCYCNKCGATAYDRKAWNTRPREKEPNRNSRKAELIAEIQRLREENDDLRRQLDRALRPSGTATPKESI